MDKKSLQSKQPQTDFSILLQHHKQKNINLSFIHFKIPRFIRDSNSDKQIHYSNPNEQEYGEILAKKYYDKLYKEYAIVDLSRYLTGQIGMRWQTKDEVLSGKGVQTCANKICKEKEELTSYEVNFGYQEDDIKKNALVKVRVCKECSSKLNHKIDLFGKQEQHKICNEEDKKEEQDIEMKKPTQKQKDSKKIKKKEKHSKDKDRKKEK